MIIMVKGAFAKKEESNISDILLVTYQTIYNKFFKIYGYPAKVFTTYV